MIKSLTLVWLLSFVALVSGCGSPNIPSEQLQSPPATATPSASGRDAVKPESGGTFRITPERPVTGLRQEALESEPPHV